MPLIDSQPHDLVVDDGDRLHRVQVKATTLRNARDPDRRSRTLRDPNLGHHGAAVPDLGSEGEADRR
jgi:hypothetical protein